MECEIQGINISYEVIGEGQPIVMLHGGYLDHRHMLRDMEPLFKDRSGWKRIYPDLPGHGKTPAKDWIINHDQVLDIILDFIDKVIPGQSFLVVGCSRGGYLARGVIHKKPELVDGAFLFVPPPPADVPDEALPPPVVLVKDEALVAEVKPNELPFFEMFVVQSRKALDVLREVAMPALELTDQAFQDRIMANYDFSFDVDHPSKPFEKPVLILTGRQDSRVGYEDAWKLLENYPRATFAVLDRAGHGLALEQEGLFMALADEWLQRVEEYSSSK
jgi:pimeloyl-ACP methyl ester carboxylesterase